MVGERERSETRDDGVLREGKRNMEKKIHEAAEKVYMRVLPWERRGERERGEERSYGV